MANSTADTPNVSETALAGMRKGDLQDYARSIGVKKIDDLKKPELLAVVKDKVYADAHGGKHRDGSSAGKTGANGKAGDKANSSKSRKKAAGKNSDSPNEGSGNSTADTPNVSETALAAMRKGDLQDYARGIGLKKIDDLKKPELLAVVKDKVYADAHDGKHRDGSSAGKTGADSKRSKKENGKKAGSRRAKTDKAGSETSGRRNSTPDTPNVSETALAGMRKGALQDYARGIGLKKVDDLNKPKLLAMVKDKVYADAHGGRHRPR
jgi:hypothetical protein